jgi:hypothetical protein
MKSLKEFNLAPISHIAVFFIFISVTQSFSQTWLQPHASISLDNVPSKVSIGEIVSTNAGNQLGTQGIPNPGVINTMRDFYHMEIDYNYSYFPNEGKLNANTCDCSNSWCNNGNCSTFINNPNGPSSFTSKKDFYCNWNGPNYQFGEVYSTLEALFIKSTTLGSCSNADIMRSYPDKWYSLTEWGGIGNIRQNFIDYLEPWLESYCPNDPNKPCLIDVLEVGNEPWGDPYPGRAGYHQMLSGAVQAFSNHFGSSDPNDWRMKLSTAAFEAHDANPNNFGATEMYVEDMLPDSLLSYFDFVAIHPYAFPLNGATFAVDQRPEAEGGAYLTFKNLVEWKNQKMPHARVNITEFGWNAGLANDGCGPFGESSQSSYIMRGLLLALRNGVHRAFVYSIDDSNEYPLYCTIGLYKDLNNGVPRKIMESIIKLKASDLSDKRFLKAIHEDTDEAGGGINGKYVYLLGDSTGKPTHVVAWRPDVLSYEDQNYPNTSSTYTHVQLPDTSMKFNPNSNYWYLSWDNSKDGNITSTGNGVVDLQGSAESQINIKLSALPIVIPIESENCLYNDLGQLYNCDGTSISEKTNLNSLRLNIYPNPGLDFINVNWIGKGGSLTIFNNLGELILARSINDRNPNFRLDVSRFSNGLYQMNIQSNGQSSNQKFIIQ